ncbi:MAG: M28 family peptidase [Acidobacteria bacterium]|nr:M28 family peptidase [Acidobacteriota bacterium]MBI3423338.1 M28 family peptidase [Acidobacteriota bacterium]
MRNRLLIRIAATISLYLLALQTFSPVFTVVARKRNSLTNIHAQTKHGIDWEENFRAVPKTENLREYMNVLAAEPHHLGSPADKRNAEWMRERLISWGLQTKLEEYDVLFPTPKERVVELIAPEKYNASLKEPALKEDADSGDANQLPVYNAYSGEGDVTAQLVYANYGVPADYEVLAKLGVDVKGKIVIARYGGSWRGIKPKVAYEHGAVGCLIYSDPKDDGYYQGDVYPKGPWRPEFGAQRGSVMDMPIHPGDPLTPGIGATKEAKRLTREEAKTILKIPVLPISYGDALPLLKSLGGQVVPDNWRGALPVTYHTGPGPATVHLKATFDWKQVTLYDVIAKIEGSAFPDEWIIRGNHHDAWVNGADDPVSGMVAVLEEARAFGELLKQGWRPKRTIIFCAWDGEEQGLLGSTEWVEQHAEELKQKAVAYLNSDSTSKGWFNASGSHSLEHFINDVARSVNDPKRKQSLWEAMQARRLEQARGDEERNELRNRGDLRISALGSGSDYTAFIDHLGIASLNIGFGGEAGGGIYHSIYDSIAWYQKFSDGTFEYGRTLVQAAGTATLRLADAQVLPFEFTNLAETISGYVDELAKLPKQNVDLAPLRKAAIQLRNAADSYDRAVRSKPSNGAPLSTPELKALNALLYQSERKLLSDAGLPRRAWFKHQIYAPGFYTGYGVKTLPGVREALEQKNWAEANEQVKVVSQTLDGMAAQVNEAARKLQGQ